MLALAAVAAVGSPSFAAEYTWQLPPGFPAPKIPADNPMSEEKVTLGCRLFFDTRLSVTGAYACASCHRPEFAFTDGRTLAIGATGEMVRRNAMTLANVAYNPSFTWASDRLTTLEAQMATPLFGRHPVEMGLANIDASLPAAIATDERYVAAFGQSFPVDRAPVSMRNAVKAIAAFERTLLSGRSSFDQYVLDDDRAALSDVERRGMALFFSERVGCTNCHFGLNLSGSVVHQRTTGAAAPTFANTGLYNVDGKGAYPSNDTGLNEVTRKRRDMGKFRVPTLRNVELTAPYMHDGSIATLPEVIDHYAQGGRQQPRGSAISNSYKDVNMKPIVLSATEKEELVAFLKSLTDREFADQARYGCQ